MATEEMRNDFDEMAANNMVPKDYQLKVRTHPGMLMVTSLTKMREHEKIQVGFSGKLIQTYAFKKDDINSNYNDFKYLASRLSDAILKKNKSGAVNALLWKDVDSNIITDFISTYRNEYSRFDIIKSYIEKQNQDGLLNKWSVAISVNSKPSKSGKIQWNNGSIQAGYSSRNLDGDQTNELIVRGGKNAILFKEHKIVDLTYVVEPKNEDEIKQLRKDYGNPLLIIVPIDPSIFTNVDSDIPIIGFGLIFPIIDSEKLFEYAARPLNLEFEEEPQQSDDKADDEN